MSEAAAPERLIKSTRYTALLPVFGLLLAGHLLASPGDDLERGKKIYEENCADCHGSKGRGDGREARRLGFRPRDLSLGAFKCRCTASGDVPTDEDLARIISRGMPGTPMKGFREALSREDTRAVAQYVKTLSPRFAGASEPACAVPAEPVPSPAATAAEGKHLYRLLQCWTCHGKAGHGDGPAARDLKDDWGQRIRAYDFTQPFKLKCGGTDADLYRLLWTGMNGSPMPAFGDALSFPREGVESLDALEGRFRPAEIQETADFVKTQPARAALDALSPEERSRLADRRAWALIHFLRTLVSSSP